MSSSRDSLDSHEAAGATMLFGGASLEMLKADGYYTAICNGPIESRRDEYNAIRANIAAEEHALRERAQFGRRFLGLIEGASDGIIADLLIQQSAELAAWRTELAAIPTEEKWRDDVHNLVTTVGKNLLCDTIFGNAAAGTVAMGLKSSGTALAADTMASHGSWTEITNIAARLAPSFSAASAGSKTTSATVNFTLTSGSGVVIAGVFVVIAGSTTVSNTTGTLFSAGDFSGGNKTASSGDTVQVTYTLSV